MSNSVGVLLLALTSCHANWSRKGGYCRIATLIYLKIYFQEYELTRPGPNRYLSPSLVILLGPSHHGPPQKDPLSEMDLSQVVNILQATLTQGMQ